MKRLVLLVVLVLCAMAGYAQKGKPTPAKPAENASPKEDAAAISRGVTAQIIVDHYFRKYSFAQRWGDYDVAKDALYDLIAEFPGNDSLIFQLAYFYYENQKHASCAVVCNDLLTRNSRNTAALELSAVSYENLGLKDKALQSYESLFLLTSSNSTLYKMASLQYDLKRYGESLTNSDILLSKPQTDSLKVVFNDAKNNSKEHPLKAAILNLKGLSFKAQGDVPNARKSFEEALKIDPAFEAAKQNLASLK
jgi:tetratricopeptide (TPR) repeat protein